MSLKEFLTKASTQTALAVIVVGGGLCFLAFVNVSEVIKTTVSNMMIMVLGFYFGSSRGSQIKDLK